MYRTAQLFVAAASVALSPVAVASAATFDVNEVADLPLHPTAPACVCRVDSRGARCSLRAAIQAANACPGHDVVDVRPIGPFLVTIAGPAEDAGATGDFDVTESVTVLGNGQWVRAAVTDRVLDVQVPAGHDVNVSSLRMSYGAVYSDPLGANGGAIRSLGADLTLDEVHLDFNHAASQGGGLYTQGGEVTILNGLIEHNTSDVDGGGARIDEADAASVLDTQILDNDAPGFGGGLLVYRGGATLVQNVELSGNAADTGAGALASSSGGNPITFDQCHFYRNEASLYGGGLVSEVDASEAEVVVTDSLFELNQAGVVGGGMLGPGTVTSSTFRGNSAGSFGGGLALRAEAGLSVNGILALENLTLQRNTAGQAGGGIFVGESTVDALHVTFDTNSASWGGSAIYALSNVQVRSSILSWPGGAPSVPHCNQPVSVGHNVVTDLSCGALGTDQLVSNAGLGAYGYHGGPTPTIMLLSTSPAMDAADPSACPATDQRGQPRPSGPGCDSGAYERQL